jgi:hypothetical protein
MSFLSMTTGACHHTQLFGWDGGLTNIFPRLALNHSSPHLCLLEIIRGSHHTQLEIIGGFFCFVLFCFALL